MSSRARPAVVAASRRLPGLSAVLPRQRRRRHRRPARLIDGLPYLASLGVDAIWLSPFYPSPQRDSGYDVADPRGVDPMYGTLDDAGELIAGPMRAACGSSSTSSRTTRPATAPGSRRRSRRPRQRRSGPATTSATAVARTATSRRPIGSAGSAAVPGPAVTEADGSPGQWYLHTFDASQPDLNWSNPEVVADGLETLRFWLDLGADGFRVDVALGLAKDMTYPDIDDPESLILAMRMDLDDGSAEAMASAAPRGQLGGARPRRGPGHLPRLAAGHGRVRPRRDGGGGGVGPAGAGRPLRRARHPPPDLQLRLHGGPVGRRPAARASSSRRWRGWPSPVRPPTWALSNHDSPRVVSRLGGGDEGRRRARALALVAHALPGAVYVYQGEELGLADVDLPDEARQDPVFFRTNGEQKGRDAARVPMPWAGDAPPYGFGSTARTRGCRCPPAGRRSPSPPRSRPGQRPVAVPRRCSGCATSCRRWLATTSAARDAGRACSSSNGVPGFACVVNCSAAAVQSPVPGPSWSPATPRSWQRAAGSPCRPPPEPGSRSVAPTSS